MIVNVGNSQIDDETYRPLVMVKNGVATSLFSEELVDLSSLKKLKLPNARYDYLLTVKKFSYDSNGVTRFLSMDTFKVDRKQTEIEINVEGLGYVEASLITTEI